MGLLGIRGQVSHDEAKGTENRNKNVCRTLMSHACGEKGEGLLTIENHL